MALLQFYSRWMISQISSVSFLVCTLLCVGSWNTDSWGVWSQNRGSVRGVKYHCLECKRQFARSRQLSEFHIFAPRNAAPCIVPPGADAPVAPFPVQNLSLSLLRSMSFRYIIYFFKPDTISSIIALCIYCIQTTKLTHTVTGITAYTTEHNNLVSHTLWLPQYRVEFIVLRIIDYEVDSQLVPNSSRPQVNSSSSVKSAWLQIIIERIRSETRPIASSKS